MRIAPWQRRITTSHNALPCTWLWATCNCFSGCVSPCLPLWIPYRSQHASFASAPGRRTRSRRNASFSLVPVPSMCRTTPDLCLDAADYVVVVVPPFWKTKSPCDDAFSSGSDCCCCWRCSTEHLSRSIRFLSLLVKVQRYKFPAAHKKVFRALFSVFKRDRKQESLRNSDVPPSNFQCWIREVAAAAPSLRARSRGYLPTSTNRCGKLSIYLCNQQRTNKQTHDLLFRLFFLLPLQSLDRLSSTENEGKNKQTNKTTKKQRRKNKAKKNFKIQTLPSPTSSGDGAMG